MTVEIDPAQAEPSLTPASAARVLIRSAAKASMATLMPEPDGWPFASMVIPATDIDVSPLLVLSDLAQHARNLARDPRASLLFEADAAGGDPQATPRITLVGRILRTEDDACRRRYVTRYTDSYLGVLGDFHLYRMAIERAYYIGGFARARRIEPAELLLPTPALSEEETILLGWLNQNDGALIGRIAELSGMPPGDWRAVGLDGEGCDIAAETTFARISLPAPVRDARQFTDAVEALMPSIERL